MSNATTPRQIPVYTVDKVFPVDKELVKQLREMKISRGFLNSMKSQAVNCPMVGGESPAIKCLACQYFVRRVKGTVYCKFGLV
ncbi:MAG: hypothetical protein QW767_03375 [Thermoprotei archaeon]